MREVRLKDATEKEIRQHYEDRNKMSIEFNNQRPSFYMTTGSFNSDPLIADYKHYMIMRGITTIAID